MVVVVVLARKPEPNDWLFTRSLKPAQIWTAAASALLPLSVGAREREREREAPSHLISLWSCYLGEGQGNFPIIFFCLIKIPFFQLCYLWDLSTFLPSFDHLHFLLVFIKNLSFFWIINTVTFMRHWHFFTYYLERKMQHTHPHTHTHAFPRKKKFARGKLYFPLLRNVPFLTE